MNYLKITGFVLTFSTLLVLSLVIQLSHISSKPSVVLKLLMINITSKLRSRPYLHNQHLKTNHVYLVHQSSIKSDDLRFPKPLFYKKPNRSVYSETTPTKETLIHEEDNEKIIVFYTTTYGETWMPMNGSGDGTFLFIETSNFICPKKCAFTHNKTLASIADAVVFDILDALYHNEDQNKTFPESWERKKGQMWIAGVFEPSIYHNYALDSLENLNFLFNWTASYRLNSDIYWPYGFIYKLEKPRSEEDMKIPNKTDLRRKRLAASLISNCKALSYRDDLLSSLKRFLFIDSYGKCGDKKCPQDSKCREYLANHYKFFMAFENSLCQDYITEKFFTALQLGIVPVTYGLGTYSEIAPPNSYINVLDFPSVKALATYLLYLDQNDEEYLRYLDWRRDYAVAEISRAAYVCSICMKVWEPFKSKRISEGINAWWNHKRPEEVTMANYNSMSYKLQNWSTTACVSIMTRISFV